MNQWEKMHEETRDNFDLVLAIDYENIHPRDCFEPEDVEEICRQIDNHSLIWFVARVTASRHGIELGRDYLCGCLYENINEFIADPYYSDMCSNAISDARANLKLLNEEITA